MIESHSSQRVIIHADMDAFFAQVEQLDHPHLRGQPIAIGGLGARAVVATASYEARPFGIRSAMPMAVARRQCPDLIVVQPRFERYKAVSNIIMDVFRWFASPIEPMSLDEAFMDVSENVRDLGGPGSLGQAIKDAVHEATGGLTVSVGIASTKLVAKLASDVNKPNGLTIVHPQDVHTFLAPMAVGKLWGVGPKTASRIEAAGFHTIGKQANARLEDLAFLGRHAHTLHALANGIDHRSVQPRGRAKSVGWERTLSHNVTHINDIKPILKQGAVELARRLHQRKVMAVGLRLKAKTSGFQVMSRQRVVNTPIMHAPDIYRVVETLYNELPKGRSYRLLGVSAFSLESRSQGIQLILPIAQDDPPPTRSSQGEENSWIL
ncbi:MAG: DNA polymerase IV [Myxococcota bacterium]|nr:DNA polymerase IV [Myxococcota bacterium]